MSELRMTGLLVGIGLLAALFLYRRFVRRLSNFTMIISLTICTLIIVFALFPNTLNDLLITYSLKPENGQRLIGLLMLSNLLIFLFLFILAARHDALQQTVDRLVTAITKQAYQGEHVGAPILVVIPAYDEEENIGLVLDRIPKEVCGKQVEAVVVVDGGTDRTAEVVKARKVGVATHVINRGQAASLRVGYSLAIERGAEIVVTLDADNQHHPEEMARLVKPILDGKADMVNGSRVLGHYEKDSQVRALGVVLFNYLISFMAGTRITDCSNGFRAIRTSCLRELTLVQTQYHATEMLLECLRRGFRFQEVPITISNRTYGVSKKGPSMYYALGFLRTIVVTWLR
ncbi:MAG: glycosyltransferase family 2 protein [Chloroflexota bacterium]